MMKSIWHLHRFKIRLWRYAGLGWSLGHDGRREEWFDLEFTNWFPYIHVNALLRTQMPRFPFQRGNPRHPLPHGKTGRFIRTSFISILVLKHFARQQPAVK
jgi:hypothetical protein